jgi:hypothetical protein
VSFEGPRVLDKPFPGSTFEVTEVEPYYGISGTGWEAIDATTFVIRGYFDLAGYGLEELTAFFQGVEIQEAWSPHGNMSFSFVYDMVTTEFIDNASIALMVLNLTGDPPGFPESTYDMSQVVYGRTRTFKAQTIAANPVGTIYQTSSTKWGTCQGTTGDKLFITRVLKFVGTAPEFISIPASNFVVAAIVAKEDDIPYLMRMLRSYELERAP